MRKKRQVGNKDVKVKCLSADLEIPQQNLRAGMCKLVDVWEKGGWCLTTNDGWFVKMLLVLFKLKRLFHTETHTKKTQTF